MLERRSGGDLPPQPRPVDTSIHEITTRPTVPLSTTELPLRPVGTTLLRRSLANGLPEQRVLVVGIGDYARGKTDEKGSDGEYKEAQGVVTSEGERNGKKFFRVTDALLPGEPGNDTQGIAYDNNTIDQATAHHVDIPEKKKLTVWNMQDQLSDRNNKEIPPEEQL